MITTKTNVVLPDWCLKGTSQEEIKQNILQYMKRYEGYKVLRVKNGIAICERGD